MSLLFKTLIAKEFTQPVMPPSGVTRFRNKDTFIHDLKTTYVFTYQKPDRKILLLSPLTIKRVQRTVRLWNKEYDSEIAIHAPVVLAPDPENPKIDTIWNDLERIKQQIENQAMPWSDEHAEAVRQTNSMRYEFQTFDLPGETIRSEYMDTQTLYDWFIETIPEAEAQFNRILNEQNR